MANDRGQMAECRVQSAEGKSRSGICHLSFAIQLIILTVTDH